LISPDDYAVRLLDMPASVGGFIKESPDGFLNIYINARHSREGQRRSCRHELRHAENDDLRSTEPLEVIEARAAGVDPRLKAIPHLLRARDLLPPPKPTPKPAPQPLTPYQARVLAGCITELDRWVFSGVAYDY
jgi:hypothetical protein